MPTFCQCPRCFYPCWHAWTPWKMWNFQFAENSYDSNMVSGFIKRFLKIATFTESTLMNAKNLTAGENSHYVSIDESCLARRTLESVNTSMLEL